MQRRRLSTIVVVALVLLAGLFVVSQYPEIFVSAQNERDRTVTSEVESSSAAPAIFFFDNPYLVADVAEAANPATVYIQVKWKTQDQASRYYSRDPFSFFFDYFFWGIEPYQRPSERITQGSGFIIDESGIVLTNQHVVGNAGEGQEITVTVTSPQISGDFQARILGSDATLDLAVLQIEGAEGPFPTVPLGDSDKARQGEFVIAIGNPYGRQFDHTVTIGVLSAKGREIEIIDANGSSKTYKNLMQTDAAINSGNSGGPLLNIKGEVIGINAAVHAQAQGIGFAIPINVAKEVLQELIETGSVQRAWLGIEYLVITDDIQRYYRLPDKKGVIVAEVHDGTPAAEAGIRAGDVIRRINDTDILTKDDLANAISQHKPGDEVMLTIYRRGQTLMVLVTLGNRPAEYRD
ncbi:MAG TPA: trypsin-like peptidase domain-containing protein [Limnochordia bacterium]|nr:trypsin-like peptidase domain-containing protein [Limnochordia bacterium]